MPVGRLPGRFGFPAVVPPGVANGLPCSRAVLIQLGLPQVGAGSFFGVGYLVWQMGQLRSTVAMRTVLVLISSPYSSRIHRWVVAEARLIFRLFVENTRLPGGSQ